MFVITNRKMEVLVSNSFDSESEAAEYAQETLGLPEGGDWTVTEDQFADHKNKASFQWQQGTLDSLYLAKNALELAIKSYEGTCKSDMTEPLQLEGGPLFGTLDLIDTVEQELKLAKSVAVCQTIS